jgi:acyl-CoA synthetase (AMP-forming)/AMP-acid ligase II
VAVPDVSVLSHTLAEAARRFPERRALVHREMEFTYGRLDALATELAAGLAKEGIQTGDVAALVLPAGPEYVLAYLALARLGAIATGVGHRYTPDERAKVLVQADPTVVLTTEELAVGVPSGPPMILVRPAADVDDVWRDVRVDAAPPPAPATEPDLVETIVFTSGTTGTPKGAVFTSRQIAAITRMDTGGAWGAGGSQVVATGLPHVGFMTKLAGNVQQGLTMHLLARWRAADVLDIIARERIAHVGGVAAQVALLLRVPGFDSYDLSAVRGLIVGAGPSPPAIVREARTRFDAGYSIRYSSTESGGLGTLTAFDAPDEEALHTVGRPRPGTDLSIRSTVDGAVLPVGETGEVFLRSTAVMAGYWRDPDATARALDAEGWLHTGDVGWVGEDGCLRLTGRIKEMYIRGGYNVYPLEVEGVLLDHPAVASVAVVPRPSSVMGEIGVAVVVPRDGAAPPTLDDLRAFAAARLVNHKLPEAIRIVDAIPLTGMDKVDRRALAAREADAAE